MYADLKADIHSLKARKLHDLESKETNAVAGNFEWKQTERIPQNRLWSLILLRLGNPVYTIKKLTHI